MRFIVVLDFRERKRLTFRSETLGSSLHGLSENRRVIFAPPKLGIDVFCYLQDDGIVVSPDRAFWKIRF
jgi:hypothetical protein